ncbi:MAG: hypothetical protein A2X46_12900 [Lentisphaerae bacterium GWF2_57_35]|nr:MAG: hypothetical protein A2X46_12900 [Lentisphaerae bacterium GWF2_57_35]
MLAAGSSSSAYSARVELDLSGTWEMQKTSQLSYPPTNTWQTVTVPGYVSGWQYEHAWFRKTFSLTSSVAGTQLKLCFGGVKFDSQVWLNGIALGGYLNGYEPFELDITAAALPGQTNELVVGVTDWTATFSQPVDFSNMRPNENPRDRTLNTLLSPIGGRYDLYGIWQPVKVLSVPAVSVAEVFVMPSVRNRQLTVRLALRNDGLSAQSTTLSNLVLDAGVEALSLPTRQLLLPPGATTNLEVGAAWPAPHFWSHEDPFLYTLETTLSHADGSSDQVSTRFGFREFWCEADRFFLNGTPINLRATSAWPPFAVLEDAQIRTIVREVKAGNNVAMRLHTQPWDERWYELADEEGLLVVEEAAIWCDSYNYRLADPVFWTNYARHLAAMVKRDGHHPSIVMWSLENEVLHCGGQQAYTGAAARLAEMGRTVKRLDPTRPITFESDLDPEGEADVIGLHYPHEYPVFSVWPNTAYWMDQFIERDWAPGGQWKWDRAKPLYIGEFLWVFGTSAQYFTALFGDDAYADPAGCRNRAKAQTWRMQIEAYRAYGVNGLCPWTAFEDLSVPWGEFGLRTNENILYQSQQAAYHPNAVFAEEYNTRFFTGETTQRHLRIYNDRMTGGEFVLKWRAGDAAWQTTSFTLPPAAQRQETISFPAPSSNGPFALQLELTEGPDTVFSNSIACTAMPRPSLSLPPGYRLGVYDPRGAATGLLARSGLTLTNVADLHAAPYAQLDLLIIGAGALTNGATPEVGTYTIPALWQDFMLRGGWVLILEQDAYPSWMPYDLKTEDFDASYAFPHPDHPIVQGLTADDLRWWGGDHRLVIKALSMPSRGNFRALAAVGSIKGLEHAAAVERPVGLGGLLCSQWLLTERFDVEPLAGLLLQRTLDYVSHANGHLRAEPVGLLSTPDSAAAVKLAELGLLSENLRGRMASADLSLHPVLVVAGGESVWQEALQSLSNLSAYVENGGKLLLHRPDDSFLAAAQPTLFPQLDPTEEDSGLVLRRNTTNAFLRLANHDLYWIEEPGQMNTTDVLSTNVARRFYRKSSALSVFETIQVEDMPFHSAGSIGDGIWNLYSNGYAEQDITVAQSGTHLFNVYAYGAPALGVWPQLSLAIDGRVQDAVSVSSAQWAYYTLMADLTTGTHALAISFDNDVYAPPDDRNLYLDEIRWGYDSDPTTTLLTQPGVVAQVRRGAGSILLDEILWEHETNHTAKAERLASTLLTGLGAALLPSPALPLQAIWMTNVNVMSYQTYDGLARLNSGGHIQMPICFTAAGDYVFTLEAGGVPAAGVYPLAALLMDGVTQQTFFVTSTAMNPYTFTLSVATGLHTVALAFLNDYYNPPEDRNLVFGRLTIAPQAAPFDAWKKNLFSPAEWSDPSVSGRQADPDGDGLDNESEYLADTHPKDRQSLLQLTGLRCQPEGVHLDWKGGREAKQILQFCTPWNGSSWMDVFTNPPPTLLETEFLCPVDDATGRFYRIKTWRE